MASREAQRQATCGYSRNRFCRIWKARKAAASEEITIAERSAKAIQDNLNRLDEAFLFERSIDIETYDRKRGEMREELTHSGQLDELDVEGTLRSQNGFCREPQTSGCRHHSNSDSGSNNSSFETDRIRRKWLVGTA